MKHFSNISLKSKIALGLTVPIMLSFFIIQSCIVFGCLELSMYWAKFGYICVIAFVPPFVVGVREFISKTKKQSIEKRGLEHLLDSSSLVSKTDKNGKIIAVNKKFLQVSGYSEKELLGQDHSMLNSGKHSKSFWNDMYRAVIVDKKIWNELVTNRNKKGELYIVNSWIAANFNDEGKLTGFTSVRQDVTNLVNTLEKVKQKDVYLEHAAKIIRHDMHSGINTYLPRGIKSLKRRLSDGIIKELKIASPLKLIEDGLHHAQKVYSGVYEFTNLVKQNSQMSMAPCDIKLSLNDYLKLTAYKNQVILNDNLPKTLNVNEALFCTAVDNLIRNGLKYNDSKTKWVKIYSEFGNNNEQLIIIEDNGRGLNNDEFLELSKPYVRKEGQEESGTGLGLNICISILKEHRFDITAEKTNQGTKIKIKI